MKIGISYLLMVPLLGALAIVQSVVGPRLAMWGVRPDLLLLVVLVWTLLHGSREGIVWGFVGGIWMDVLGGGPMGGASMALMAASLVAGVGYHRLFRSNPLVPFAAAVLGTLTYSFTYMGILVLTGHPLPWGKAIARLVAPAVLYNTVLMMLFAPFLNRVFSRQELDELV